MVVAQKRQIALREYSEATLGGAGLETVKTNLGKEKNERSRDERRVKSHTCCRRLLVAVPGIPN
jgi:hypothetical protein